MPDRKASKEPMAVANQPTTGNRTGSWRFERPVFVEGIAPCSEACPVGEDIATIMALNEAGNFADAYARILQENPFPGLCGAVCHSPCERVCNRGRYDQAVSVKDLEHFVAGEARRRGFGAPSPSRARATRIAVAGSGPAGWSCAYFLRLLGHQVCVFAEIDGIPFSASDSRLAPEVQRWELDQVRSVGVDVNRDARLESLADLASRADGVYVSRDAGEGLIAEMKDLVDHSPREHVAVASGVRRSHGVLLSRHPLSDTRIVCPDSFSSRAAEAQADKSEDISRAAVRAIAAGKLAAIALDMSLQGTALDRIRDLAVGRLGALSMETYRVHRHTGSERRLERVVRFAELNLADYQKSKRVGVLATSGGFNRLRALQSARRCFKCGICTYCRKCCDYCPDVAIAMDVDHRSRSIHYDYCKGCGICAQECPRGAIAWIQEESKSYKDDK